jgi:hypothetical protein
MVWYSSPETLPFCSLKGQAHDTCVASGTASDVNVAAAAAGAGAAAAAGAT